MGYWLNGGLIGIIFILTVSMMLTPLLCNSIKEKYSDVSCKIEDNIATFSRIYTQIYALPLLLVGFLAGASIGRLVFLIKKRYETKSQILLDRIDGKKKFRWMWEYKK